MVFLPRFDCRQSIDSIFHQMLHFFLRISNVCCKEFAKFYGFLFNFHQSFLFAFKYRCSRCFSIVFSYLVNGDLGSEGRDEDFVRRNKVTKFLTITEQVSVLNFNASVQRGVHGTVYYSCGWESIRTCHRPIVQFPQQHLSPNKNHFVPNLNVGIGRTRNNFLANLLDYFPRSTRAISKIPHSISFLSRNDRF